MAATGSRRILVVSAGFDHRVNELASVWQWLADRHDVDIRVLALAADRLKSHHHSGGSERFGRLEVHWLEQGYPLAFSPQVDTLARAFAPDTVFAGPRDHLDVALEVAAATQSRCALHVEYFFTDDHWLRRREYLGIRALRGRIGGRSRRDVLSRVDRVFVSDPLEQARLSSHPALRYLPWPHLPPPAATVARAATDPSRLEVVYIGSLFKAKGAARLAQYLASAAQALPQLRLRVVGPAVDTAGERAITALQAAAGERFDWTRSLPRAQALACLQQATCVISPGRSHGWGLIGDAWHLRVPVIAAHAHYDLQDGINCRIAPDPGAFVEAIRTIAGDRDLRERLIAGGSAAVAAHSLERSATALAAGLGLSG